MVWCGVVWCGVVWCGVVWCGLVWFGVVSCDMLYDGGVWRDVVWCGRYTRFLEKTNYFIERYISYAYVRPSLHVHLYTRTTNTSLVKTRT